MRLTIFTEPQLGASYDDLLRIARHAEGCGYDGFFRSDHYLTMDGHDGLPGPTDAWTTLAGLARDTGRLRLGTLVSSATFRLPGPLAITVAQVDAMSGGRVELGLGAGWFADEHRAYGIPFPPLAERFDRLTEQLEIITGLWHTPAGERFSYEGAFYDVGDSPALPKPVQSPGPTVIVGGAGPRRTPALAARFADEFNVPFRTLAETRRRYGWVREACAAQGRDGRAPLVLSAAQTLCCGRNDAEVARRAEAIGMSVDALREAKGLVGTPDQVVEQIGQFAEAGAARLHLQVLDLADLDHLDLVASAVAPQLAAGPPPR
jgi:F420-dependent oxidoreductase-like protein